MARKRLNLRLILACAMTTCLFGLSLKAAVAEPKHSEDLQSGLSGGRSSQGLALLSVSHTPEPQVLSAQQSSDKHVDKRSAASLLAAQALAEGESDAFEASAPSDDIDLSRYAFLEPLACPQGDEKTEYILKSSCSLTKAANNWGIPVNDLLSLNPGLGANDMLGEGQSILVDTRTPWSPVAYSRGKASRGSIANACVMPEGKGYFLRTHRPNNWGTSLTIESLVAALGYYAESYPDGPRVNIGDLSKRRGGRMRPHKSHQSGRDVDLGYIHKGEMGPKDTEHFTRANVDNLDVEKTWAVIEALIRTGNVEVIYVDSFVQKALYQHAQSQLTPQQREAIFSLPRHPASSSAKLQQWPGHRNHAHVRFRCPDNQMACLK